MYGLAFLLESIFKAFLHFSASVLAFISDILRLIYYHPFCSFSWPQPHQQPNFERVAVVAEGVAVVAVAVVVVVFGVVPRVSAEES